MDDKKLVKYLLILLFLPLALAYFSDGERFRYPCQNPANWDSEICNKPLCDVTRTCPEHIFKGQRDPRLGPPKDEPTKTPTATNSTQLSQGANCGK
jgi:hypothetical protein